MKEVTGRLIEMGRAIGLYAAGSLAAGVVGFVALPFFTRIFTPEDFGVIGLFAASVGLLTPTLSLAGYVFILYDRRDDRAASGLPEAIILITSMGTAAVILSAAIGRGMGWLDDVPWILIAFGLLTAWANVWVMVRLHTYQANQQPGRFFVMSAVPPIASFALTLTLATRIDEWVSRIWALTVVAVITATWSAYSLGQRTRLSLRAGSRHIREVARFGAPLVVHTASIWIVGFTDRFIVAEREGLAAAGIYTVAYSLGLGVSSVHDGVSRYFVSRLPGWSETKPGRQAASRFAYFYSGLAIATIPILVPVALVGLRLLASDDFAGGADLLVWLIPAQTFAGISRVFTGYLYIENRTRHRAVLSAGEAVLNVALTWVLVGAYGLVGAAVATLATYSVSMVGTFLLARSGTTLMSLSAVRSVPPR